MGAFCPDNGAYARRWDLSVLFVLLLSEMSIPETQHLQSYTQIPILEICEPFHHETLSFSLAGLTLCVGLLHRVFGFFTQICLFAYVRCSYTDLSGRNAFNKRHHHHHYHYHPLRHHHHHEQLPSSSPSSSSSSPFS